MESKWGRNVRELGLGYTGCTLAARFLADPLFVVTNEVFGQPTFRLWILPFPDSGVAFIRSGAMKPDPDLNFPYGLPVEPNVLV